MRTDVWGPPLILRDYLTHEVVCCTLTLLLKSLTGDSGVLQHQLVVSLDVGRIIHQGSHNPNILLQDP